MAIIFAKQRKKQKTLILITGLIVGVALVVLWFGYFREEKETLPTIVAPPQKIKINFEILENPFLKELRPFEKVAPFPFEDGIGRENPFLPY